jgi:hypothetical protein
MKEIKLNTINVILSKYIPLETKVISFLKLNKNIIYYYYLNKKNIFFINSLTNNEISLKTKWFNLFSRLYGLNKSFLYFIFYYIGYSKKVSFLRVEESFFISLK